MLRKSVWQSLFRAALFREFSFVRCDLNLVEALPVVEDEVILEARVKLLVGPPVVDGEPEPEVGVVGIVAGLQASDKTNLKRCACVLRKLVKTDALHLR